ncbi:MAG: SurA N-terminal domain-containing protein [Chlamydiia bacterium]|nr:SurA N-terminal domain-containing protein [Chlamydiia bacterium]
MKTFFALLLIIGSSLFGNTPFSSDPHQIAFQNSIVAKVNGKTISMLDVKKKLDLFFHRNYPHLAGNAAARYQFYQQSWRSVLMEMIDHELILADAETKEIKLSDGEVREEMEHRFGPNTMITLDKIGLSYDEAWKMVKDEMIVQRMSWWFIQMRAMQKVTPEDIRQAYRLYTKEHPAYQEWKYTVISVRGDGAGKVATQLQELVAKTEKTPEELSEQIKVLETPDALIQIANPITANDKDLSDAHKSILTQLAPGQYSLPALKQSIYRIFYCYETSQHPAPKFEEMLPKLQELLTQEAARNESIAYIEKLRKHYGFDANSLKQTLPDNLEPFEIQ